MPAITMPKLSDSMEEGVILEWLVEDGAPIEVGTDIAEIETDKATMVFQSELAGTLRIVAQTGASIPVGAPIGEVLAAGEVRAAPAAAANPQNDSPVLAHRGSVAAAPTTLEGPVPRAQVSGASTGARVSASPIARRMAASRRIDLAGLVGSGPFGRIVKRDVLALPSPGDVESGNGTAPELDRSQVTASVATAAAPAGAAAPPFAPPGGGRGAVTTTEPTRIQAAIARHMLEAKSEMPEFTLEAEVDMDAAVKLREEFKALGDQIVPSYNDFVVRACALALRAHPWANGAFRDGRFEHYERINVGVAVAVPGSLLVPTVYDADRRSLGDIARATRQLAETARAGKLMPSELDGGTFSVSNLGMFGIRRFTAVLNPPQAAILAVGALEQRPVVRDAEIVPGHRMALTLTCDHRILYGADAASFLAAIRANLEAPLRLVI